MGYQALNFGYTEQNLDVKAFRRQIKMIKTKLGIDYAPPYISANIFYKDGKAVGQPYKIIDINGVKLGIIGVSEKNIAAKGFEYKDIVKALKKYMPELLAKSHFQILLASVDEKFARELGKLFPQFEIIFFGGKTIERHSWIHSSLYGPFGLGADKGAPFLLREGNIGRFQLLMLLRFDKGRLVELKTKEFELTDKYKDDVFFAQWTRVKMSHALKLETEYQMDREDIPPPGPDAYMPPSSCAGEADAGCHREIFDVWQNMDHAKAYSTLIYARPKNIYTPKHNPLCVQCHTLGLGEADGGYWSPFEIPLGNRSVSCSNCHGYAEQHAEVDNPMDIIRYKIYPQIRKPGILVCLKCHNKKHDSDFDYVKALKKISEYDGKKHFDLKSALIRYALYKKDRGAYKEMIEKERREYQRALKKYRERKKH